MRLEVVSVAAVAAVAATAAYIRRLRADLAAAKRDNDEFVAAALRDKLEQQQQQPPPQQVPPQQAPPQQVIEHKCHTSTFECCSRARPCAYPAPHFTRIRHSTNRSFDLLLMSR